MRIAIIGRTEILYDTAIQLMQAGHVISCILTAKEAPEYSRTSADFKALADQWNIPFAQGPRIDEHLDFLHIKPQIYFGIAVFYASAFELDRV